MIDRLEIIDHGSPRPNADHIIFCDGAGGNLFRENTDLELSHWRPNRTPAEFRAGTMQLRRSLSLTKWKEFLSNLSAHCQFQEPVSAFQRDEAEKSLDVVFPNDLRELLRETNGVEGKYGLGLLWPLERIVKDNIQFRTKEDYKSLYMPFSNLLFIADAGNGDQFAYPIRADGIIQ